VRVQTHLSLSIVRVGPFLLGISLITLAAAGQEPSASPAPRTANASTLKPEPLKLEGIENVYRVGPGLFSGGEPRGYDDFSALRKLGVTTVISVDGSRPDVDEARQLGIRYIHLPVGYDGIPREQAVRLIRAIQSVDGPVFVHCHHGRHRGPTAVALCGIATQGWSKDQALAWMKHAGTSPDYRGLFATVRDFTSPSADEMQQDKGELPELAKVPALVEAMVQIDERWDRLKAIREAGFKAPKDHPDIDPPHEALQLAEAFRELLRLDETKGRGENFVRKMETAEQHAKDLQRALRLFAGQSTATGRSNVETAYAAAARSCTGCHAEYRDN
jgi:protein tyrosine phosphatase (PTP) superfamily phosphohydrolase (DUF442 family)